MKHTQTVVGEVASRSYENAQKALELGLIDGFSIGERVFAKRETYIVREDGKVAKAITKGLHLIARTFSRSSYGFELDGEIWSGSKKDFGTFPNGKVILSTWTAN